jgi:TIR domain
VTDIFISYARDDDRPPPDKPDGKGFVTFLDDSVRYEFSKLGPQRPKTWRDIRRIADGDQFTPEIEEALKNASLLLVVLSPNWMASNWCKRELDTFAKYHSPDRIRERIVVVGKRHVDPEKWPSLLQGQTGFRFYVRSEDPEEIVGDLEFFDRGEARDARYWDRLRDLAAYLVRRQPRRPAAPAYVPTGRKIFVAKPASDMRTEYDRVVSELVGKGHTVVPEPMEDIPLESAVDAIDAALLDAEIAVHLLGKKSGDAPEDQPPMVRLQLAHTAARALKDAKGHFHRVVWAPSNWPVLTGNEQPSASATRRPLEVLAEFDRQLTTDKIEGDNLSKFVDFLNQHLSAISPPRTINLSPSGSSDGVRLFLCHSQEDVRYALILAQALRQLKLEPLLPAIDGPDADIKNFNGKQLAECDGVIFCWASASEVWVRAQANALRNSELGRSRQFCYRAVVAAPPPGERKKAGTLLFPRSEIDLVVDLSDKDIPTSDLLNILVPASQATAP